MKLWCALFHRRAWFEYWYDAGAGWWRLQSCRRSGRLWESPAPGYH